MTEQTRFPVSPQAAAVSHMDRPAYLAACERAATIFCHWRSIS